MTDVFLVMWFLCGMFSAVLAGAIAGNRGHSSGTFFLYGCFLPLIAIIHALLLKPTDQHLIDTGVMRECDECNELVRFNAKICKHCNNELDWKEYAEEWKDWNAKKMAEFKKKHKSNSVTTLFIVVVIIAWGFASFWVNG